MHAIARITNMTVQKNITKMTIMAKITKITKQGSDPGKYDKSLKEGWERGFTNVTKIPKRTIITKITKITNQRSDTVKCHKPLKEKRERSFPNVTNPLPLSVLKICYSCCYGFPHLLFPLYLLFSLYLWAPFPCPP